MKTSNKGFESSLIYAEWHRQHSALSKNDRCCKMSNVITCRLFLKFKLWLLKFKLNSNFVSASNVGHFPLATFPRNLPLQHKTSSYIRIRHQLTKRNMDDNKRIKANDIKLITVFVQNTSYIVMFIKFRSLFKKRE